MHNNNLPDHHQCHAAIATRDKAMDGRFVFGVATTGIYCRPSCSARRPLARHIRLFADGPAARSAGFRPCLRCTPDSAAPDAKAVAQAAARIAQAQSAGAPPPTLADLAAHTGYSPAHLQRIFKRALGVSPAAYARALLMDRARQHLAQSPNAHSPDAGSPVTGAIYAAGYNSASAFYGQAKERLGMTPSAWAKGGAGVTICWAQLATSLGPMLVAASPLGICRLAFGVGEEDLRHHFPKATLTSGGADFAALLARVLALVEEGAEQGADPATDADPIPLDVRGTAFQEAVWQALRAIPRGETRSYGQLAAAIGHPKASRATGSANGANRVAVLIPCHRVIAADGGLGGYAWGLDIKRALLSREGVQTKGVQTKE